MRPVLTVVALLLLGCSDTTSPTAPTTTPELSRKFQTYAAGVTMWRADTSWWVEARTDSYTTVRVQKTVAGQLVQNTTDYVGGFTVSRTGDWTLTADGYSITWHNANNWQRQTPKVSTQPPTEGVATGVLLDRTIPPEAIAYLMIQQP